MKRVLPNEPRTPCCDVRASVSVRVWVRVCVCACVSWWPQTLCRDVFILVFNATRIPWCRWPCTTRFCGCGPCKFEISGGDSVDRVQVEHHTIFVQSFTREPVIVEDNVCTDEWSEKQLRKEPGLAIAFGNSSALGYPPVDYAQPSESVCNYIQCLKASSLEEKQTIYVAYAVSWGAESRGW